MKYQTWVNAKNEWHELKTQPSLAEAWKAVAAWAVGKGETVVNVQMVEVEE